MRRKSKWVKFLERERKLELREETEWHNNIEKSINDKIYTSVQSETMTKKEESKDKLNLTDMENYDENGKRLSWVTENRTQRKKKKTFAEVLQIGLEKEGTFVVKEGINAVVNSPTKEIDTVNKVTLDLSEIYNDLLKSEQNGSSPMPNLPSPICTDTSTSKIASNSTIGNGCESDVCLNDYDKEILSILEDLQCPRNPVKSQSQKSVPSVQTEDCRLSGSFVSDTVFNLSTKVVTDTEVKVLKKGLDFAPIQRKLNEPELRRDLKDFCRRMRVKWYFRDEPTLFFSEQLSFSPESSWSPPAGHPNLEEFLSQTERELFGILDKSLTYSNLTKEEWQASRSLADDRSIVIKKADKGSCVLVY